TSRVVVLMTVCGWSARSAFWSGERFCWIARLAPSRPSRKMATLPVSRMGSGSWDNAYSTAITSQAHEIPSASGQRHLVHKTDRPSSRLRQGRVADLGHRVVEKKQQTNAANSN